MRQMVQSVLCKRLSGTWHPIVFRQNMLYFLLIQASPLRPLHPAYTLAVTADVMVPVRFALWNLLPLSHVMYSFDSFVAEHLQHHLRPLLLASQFVAESRLLSPRPQSWPQPWLSNDSTPFSQMLFCAPSSAALPPTPTCHCLNVACFCGCAAFCSLCQLIEKEPHTSLSASVAKFNEHLVSSDSRVSVPVNNEASITPFYMLPSFHVPAAPKKLQQSRTRAAANRAHEATSQRLLVECQTPIGRTQSHAMLAVCGAKENLTTPHASKYDSVVESASLSKPSVMVRTLALGFYFGQRCRSLINSYWRMCSVAVRVWSARLRRWWPVRWRNSVLSSISGSFNALFRYVISIFGRLLQTLMRTSRLSLLGAAFACSILVNMFYGASKTSEFNGSNKTCEGMV